MDASDFQGWPDDAQIESDLHDKLGRQPSDTELQLRLIQVYSVHILAALHEIRDNPRRPRRR